MREDRTTHLDGVDVEQRVAGAVADEDDWISEGHRRWNRSEHATLVQPARRYHTHLSINQSIYFAIKGHRPLTNHTSSTNITTERKAKLYKLCRYRYNVS